MNRILISLAMVLIFISNVDAQKSKSSVAIPKLPVDSLTGLYSYSKVNQEAGVSKDQLYSRALAWANSFYKNPGEVIREKDPVSGILVIKARFKISNEPDKKGVVTAAGDVMYSLSLNFKDGRYKYQITRINWQQLSYYPIERWKDTSSPSFKQEYAYYLKQTDENIKGIIVDFEKKIGMNSVVKTNDW